MWWCFMESVAILKKEHVGISMAYLGMVHAER